MKEDNVILQQLGDYLRDTLRQGLLDGYPYPNVASKALYNSIESVVKTTMQRITITTHALYYAKYVDEGRRVGEKGIPLAAIYRWIRQRKMSLQGKKAQSVAFAIQMSIKQHGIDPTNFIANAERQIEDSGVVDKYIERIMSNILDTHLKSMFNKLA